MFLAVSSLGVGLALHLLSTIPIPWAVVVALTMFSFTKILIFLFKALNQTKNAGGGPIQLSARAFLLELIVKIASGRETLTTADPDIGRKVLQSSSYKGLGLECFVSLRAWQPIISLESIDGDDWKRLRGAFNHLHRLLTPRLPLLQDYITESEKMHKILDSTAIHRIFATVMHRFLFGKPPTNEDVELWTSASLSFRGRIALKV